MASGDWVKPEKEFSDYAPSAPAVFYRSYSRRKQDGKRENYVESITRTIKAIAEVGKFTDQQREACLEMALNQHCFPSGRALWVAGTDWSKKPENFPGYYNCCSMQVDEVNIFGDLMQLAMMGTGTGAVLEEEHVSNLPSIVNSIGLSAVLKNKGTKGGKEDTTVELRTLGPACHQVSIVVGDSRAGWASAFQSLIEIGMGVHPVTYAFETDEVDIIIDLSQVRQAGEPLKGFGGTANPVRLEETFRRAALILSKAKGRQLTPVECCLLIDEAATAVVAGNIRRSAGMRQFSANDLVAATAKDNLYVQDAEGNWKVDVEREALKMANHTRCYHSKPSKQEILDAVTKQYWSGEGAIQYVPEIIARANADVLGEDTTAKKLFLAIYDKDREMARKYLSNKFFEVFGYEVDARELDHRMTRYGLNPCGEIAIRDNLCNLSEIHLNTISPYDTDLQEKAFYVGGLQVAALLQHEFTIERIQYSREIDPIVGVSFTGLFDFFVHAFGAPWLEWMMEGCPAGPEADDFTTREVGYLTLWKQAAMRGVIDYCKEHEIRIPNRFTTVQPAGSKSLLTGASPGWHPPKAQRFIRRITFGKEDPLVAALQEWGYNVIPAQSAKDEEGNLLNDIEDPRVREVLVEIPTEVSWANLPGCDQFDLSKLPVKSQWRLYMQVQNAYTTHNTSATLEYRENEIEELSELIYQDIQNDGGYISAALLARFDANETFPRLPFEPCSKEIYDRAMAIVQIKRSVLPEKSTILDLLDKYDNIDYELKGAAGCDSDKCLSEEKQPTTSK